MLAELKKHGYNSTFFGSIHETGNNNSCLVLEVQLFAFILCSRVACLHSAIVHLRCFVDSGQEHGIIVHIRSTP